MKRKVTDKGFRIACVLEAMYYFKVLEYEQAGLIMWDRQTYVLGISEPLQMAYKEWS